MYEYICNVILEKMPYVGLCIVDPDVIFEKVNKGGTYIVGPGQTPGLIRGVLPGRTTFVAHKEH